MIREERLLKVLRAPHVSEKASTAMEKSNTIVLKVAKDATKAELNGTTCLRAIPHYLQALPYPDGFNIIRSIRVVQLLTIVCVILISPALIRVHNALR